MLQKVENLRQKEQPALGRGLSMEEHTKDGVELRETEGQVPVSHSENIENLEKDENFKGIDWHHHQSVPLFFVVSIMNDN